MLVKASGQEHSHDQYGTIQECTTGTGILLNVICVISSGHADLVLDVPGPVGILECVECLHEVSISGTDAGYHESAAVAPQGVLEQPGKFGVPVWHMATSLGLVTKGTDHVTKSKLQGQNYSCTL